MNLLGILYDLFAPDLSFSMPPLADSVVTITLSFESLIVFQILLSFLYVSTNAGDQNFSLLIS